MNPNAMVFGGVGYGWTDFTSLQGAPDRSPIPRPSRRHDRAVKCTFTSTCCSKCTTPRLPKVASSWTCLICTGTRKPRASSDASQQSAIRLNATQNDPACGRPRSGDALAVGSDVHRNELDQPLRHAGGPIKLLPRVQRDIDDFNPGTKIAITEYNYGGDNHISGGIAEADALGIFGQQGVFAANYGLRRQRRAPSSQRRRSTCF